MTKQPSDMSDEELVEEQEKSAYFYYKKDMETTPSLSAFTLEILKRLKERHGKD